MNKYVQRMSKARLSISQFPLASLANLKGWSSHPTLFLFQIFREVLVALVAVPCQQFPVGGPKAAASEHSTGAHSNWTVPLAPGEKSQTAWRRQWMLAALVATCVYHCFDRWSLRRPSWPRPHVNATYPKNGASSGCDHSIATSKSVSNAERDAL